MATPDNGPAFPFETDEAYYPGMSLRDYVAAHAPISMLDAMAAMGIDGGSVGVLPESQRTVVFVALADMRGKYADAVLQERLL